MIIPSWFATASAYFVVGVGLAVCLAALVALWMVVVNYVYHSMHASSEFHAFLRERQRKKESAKESTAGPTPPRPIGGRRLSPTAEDMEREKEYAGCRCWDCMVAAGINIWWFHVCSKCGNKRCPHAKNHDHDCTNSNLSGQKGSLFEDCK